MKKFILEEFIENARKIHGDKYTYTDPSENIDGKFKVICPIHGPFYITRSNHINNRQGCPICAKDNKMLKHREYIKILIKDAIKSHSIKYDYSKIDLDKSVKDSQIIICPYHGEFITTLDVHINGNSDCPKCVKVHQHTTEEFIEMSKNKFGDKFIYDRTIYKNNSTNVEMECKIHGLFIISPIVHLKSKHGCQKCALESVSKNTRLNNNDFINRAIEVHKNRYDYIKTNYIEAKTPVIITCHETNSFGIEHGDFSQLPYNHLKGQGCPKCYGKYKTTEDVVLEMKLKYGDLFDFSKYVYLGSKVKSTIICKKHGEFKKSYSAMMNSIHGCNKCEKENYYYENELYKFISSKLTGVKIERNIRPEWLKNDKSGKNQELDIYIPSLNIAVEYQGRHHFIGLYGEDKLKHLQELDLEKYNKCTKLGIKLFYFAKDGRNIPETYIDKIYVNNEELFNDILLNSLNKTKLPSLLKGR